MRNWHDVLPADVAAEQRSYDRSQQVRRMREAGLTFRECAERIGVSTERARQLLCRLEYRRGLAPIIRYFVSGGEIAAVHEFLRRAVERAGEQVLRSTSEKPR